MIEALQSLGSIIELAQDLLHGGLTGHSLITLIIINLDALVW